ncbi:MAG TPA: hypothetical protein VER33_00960, partial [Polyangiaceae bacterium]|nr:hypothetical protein [Polyangiaceae bacterium]
TAGSGGASMGGAGGKAGSGGGGAGGTAGAGGSAAGSGGSGGATMPPSLGKLDGFLHRSPCEAANQAFDCRLPGCVGGVKNVTQEFMVMGGDPARIYDVTVRVAGVMEGRQYNNAPGGMGRRKGTANRQASMGDFWHPGIVRPGSLGTYNTLELDVSPAVAGVPVTGSGATAVNSYGLNSISDDPSHHVIALDYTATFPVMGGGKITFKSMDPNCIQIVNCPTTCNQAASAPLQVNIGMAMPAAPADFVQPYRNGTYYGQWAFIDVISVVAR